MSNKFAWLSEETKKKYGLMECVETKEVTDIINVFAKYGYDMRMQGDAFYCEITPGMAKELLRFDTQNRKTNLNHVKEIAGDILQNDFHISQDAMCFSKQGYILSAKHRLSGIVVANKPVVLLILTVFIDPFTQMDTGKTRTLMDNEESKNSSGVYVNGRANSVVKSIIRYAQSCKDVSFKSMSKQRKEEIILAHHAEMLEKWTEKGFNKKLVKNCFNYLTFAAMSNHENIEIIDYFITRGTAQGYVFGSTSLDAFMGDFSETMRNVSCEGTNLVAYINICKYVFSMCKQYWSNPENCPQFPFKAKDGQVKPRNRKQIDLKSFTKDLWVDVSPIEGEPLRIPKNMLQ